MAPAFATYAPRDPCRTVLYHVIAEHLETFLASCHDDPEATDLPAYVQREFYDYLWYARQRSSPHAIPGHNNAPLVLTIAMRSRLVVAGFVALK